LPEEEEEEEEVAATLIKRPRMRTSASGLSKSPSAVRHPSAGLSALKHGGHRAGKRRFGIAQADVGSIR